MAVILALLLSGCSFSPVDPVLIMAEIHGSVRYVHEDIDRWQTPDETRRRGAGDCEDFAILFMEALWLRGIESGMVLTPTETGSHAMVESRGVVYDVTGNQIIDEDLPVIERMSYGTALGYAIRDSISGGVTK